MTHFIADTPQGRVEIVTEWSDRDEIGLYYPREPKYLIDGVEVPEERVEAAMRSIPGAPAELEACNLTHLFADLARALYPEWRTGGLPWVVGPSGDSGRGDGQTPQRTSGSADCIPFTRMASVRPRPVRAGRRAIEPVMAGAAWTVAPATNFLRGDREPRRSGLRS